MAKRGEIKHTEAKIYKLPISKFVDTKFREYAIHVLQSRGIPSFYDALTPVQRYILMNASSNYAKTLSLVGKCMTDGYAHGDISLHKAIAKLTRPFGSSLQILEGYGFFGTEVSPEPAAARYTSVRISSQIGSMIKKYKDLNKRGDDGSYLPFWVDVPVGLLSIIVGISVGYKTTILPRKLEDIQDFLEGKKKRLKPYFQNFKGTIKRYDKNSWLLTSNINIEENKIKVRGIPPILKYSSVVKKIDNLIKNFEGKIRILDNSNTEVSIDIVFTGKNNDLWEELKKQTRKIFSVIVKETPIFVKDDKVLVYDNVEQYLEDFKWQLKKLRYQDVNYKRKYLENELKFNKAKKDFIIFILQKRRSYEDVDIFLKKYTDFKHKLENMTSKKFTRSELEKTKDTIESLKEEINSKKKEEKEAKRILDSTEDPTLNKGVSSRNTSTMSLFESDDIEEKNGIYIWNGTDMYDKEHDEQNEEYEENII